MTTKPEIDVAEVVDKSPDFIVNFEKVYKKLKMSTDPHLNAFAVSMGKSSDFAYKAHKSFRKLFKGEPL